MTSMVRLGLGLRLRPLLYLGGYVKVAALTVIKFGVMEGGVIP